ncbi:MAG: hypothetical protein ABSB97_04790 [Thermoplasmata archaeon]|jgi:hypothetical protein
MDATEFDKVLSSAPKPEDRIAWFGALLTKESRTKVEIVGGSAIELYLSSAEYISQDVDLVGRKDRITPTLRRWKFQPVEGRSHRVYWFKKAFGLVDIVGRGDRSGLRPRQLKTPYGPVLVSAIEPLIVRRLTRAYREKSNELYRQAVGLAKQGDLDWDYLEAMARYEGAIPLLKKLRKAVQE